MDFRKAYDSVWRKGLFFKLIRSGCSRNFIRFMLIMYSSVVTFDKLHNGITPFFKPNRGVKQTKDIPSLFTNSCTPVQLGDTDLNCLLYADDRKRKAFRV